MISRTAGIWIVVVALAGLASCYRTDDHDVWFHLAAGRSIAEHGLPSTETWCLAARGGPPWLSEWLFERALFGVHQAGGHAAVTAWRALWSMGAMALAAWLAGRLGAGALPAAGLGLLAIAASRERFQPRPEQLFLVFALAGLALFEHARAGGKDRTRWLVPIQILWANVQGSWVFGPGIAWTYAALEWWSSRGAHGRGRRGAATPGAVEARARSRRWSVLGLVLWAASAVVPRPIETLARPFRFLTEAATDPLTGSIEELRAWSFAADRFDPFTFWTAIAIVAAIAGGSRAWRRSPALVLFGLGAIVLGLAGVRFRGLAAMATLPAIATALVPSRANAGRSPRWREALCAAAALAGLFALARAPQFKPGLDPQWAAVPVRATELAERLKLSGPVLNTFHYGGYLLWARGEAHPPLIDGRGMGSAEFRSRYARAHSEPAAFDSLLAEWGFTHAVLQPPEHADDRMAAQLDSRPDWELIFADDAGLLFVRRDLHPGIAAERGYRWFGPDYAKLGEVSAKALADSALARDLITELERARRESPVHARASFWRGLLSLARGDPAHATQMLEEVERLAPATPGLALRLGMARQQVGDRQGARRAFQRALREPADAAEARQALQTLR